MSLPAPSSLQWKAIQKAKQWFSDGGQQEFKIFGPAGSGKSTLLRHLLEELGLTPGQDVVILTLLGKASDVLRRKGLPSNTIHSFLYQPSIVPPSAIEKLRREIEAETDPTEQRSLQERLRNLLSPNFRRRDLGDVDHIRLLVIDEISMVPDNVLYDILALKIPVLELGDPFQLAPVGSNCSAILQKPDVMLTEVHRQALENPILRFATRIREDRVIEKMETNECFITNDPLINLPDFLAHNFDQVICGYHRNRHKINREVRSSLGLQGLMPVKEDKLICVRNKKIDEAGRSFFNGQEIRLDNIGQANPLVDLDVSADAAPVHDDWWSTESVYLGHFAENYVPDRNRAERDYGFKLNTQPLEVDFAYAITGHKSQGSQWERVCVIDDQWGRTPEDQIRWLYTVVTRPSQQLVMSTQRV